MTLQEHQEMFEAKLQQGIRDVAKEMGISEREFRKMIGEPEYRETLRDYDRSFLRACGIKDAL